MGPESNPFLNHDRPQTSLKMLRSDLVLTLQVSCALAQVPSSRHVGVALQELGVCHNRPWEGRAVAGPCREAIVSPG